MPDGERGKENSLKKRSGWMALLGGWSKGLVRLPLLSFTQTLCFLLHNRQNNRGIRQCECGLRRSALATTTPASGQWVLRRDGPQTDG